MKRVPWLLRKECPYKVLVKMKLIVVALIAVASLQVQAGSYAQSTVTLSERNSTLIKVFKQIKKQTGYSYILTSDLLSQAGKVNIEVANVTLTDALELIFKDQPLTYSIIGKTIVVKEKEEVKKIAAAVGGLPIDVRGRVVNEKGEPVEGVTVTVKGDTKSTTTNANGEFSISTVEKDAVLIFTHISMETFELKVSGRTELAINLKAKIRELNDVIISYNTGFQEIPKERGTGSFYNVSNKIINRSVSSNIINRLENVASGFQIYKNQLSIRGRSTILANQDPLIVVDNFPYDGRIENLNPNDIESVTLLKDAAAASIWGAFSGNGVLVITTKKGRYNQPTRISFVSNITVGQRPDLFYSPEFLKSSDFIDVEQFLFSKGFYDGSLSNTSSFPAVSPVVEILALQRVGKLTADQATAQINELKQYDIRNDLEKYLYRTSVTQQYSLNITGGTAKSNYYASFGYDRLKSDRVGNSNDRVTFNAKTTLQPVSKLEIWGEANVILAKNDLNNTLGSIKAARKANIYPYARLADEKGNPLPLIQFYSKKYIDSLQGRGLLNWQYFPLNDLDLIDNVTQTNDTRFNTGLRFTIISGLSFEAKYQFLTSRSNGETLYDQNSYYVRDLVNRFSAFASDGSLKRNIPLGGIYNLTTSDITSHGGRAQLNFNKSFKKHVIHSVAGIDVRQIESSNFQNGYYGYDVNTGSQVQVNYDSIYRVLPTGTSKIPALGLVGGLLNRFRSYFGIVSYTYDSKYTVNFSSRIDQSNFFGYKANQRSVPLWSAGVKWDLDKERFYKVSAIPDLSLRLTYGFNANLDKTISPLTLEKYSTSASQVNVPYASIIAPGNPELTWEKIALLNIGIDFSIKNRRLSGSIDVFRKFGKNMIGEDVVDPTTGIRNMKGNFSDMRAKGIDLVLNSTLLQREIQWTASFLLSYANHKVTRYKGTNIVNSAIVEGRPVSATYAIPWAGLDPANGDPRGLLNDTISKNYTLLNSLAYKDRIYVGPGVPTYFGSLLNTFSYGRVEFSFNLSYKGGYYFSRSSINYNDLFNNWRGHEDYSRRWQKPGDEATTNVPSVVYPVNSARDAFYAQSEVLIDRGDYIRFEDLRIAWDAIKTKSTANAQVLRNLQLFIYVNNIGIIWQKNKQGIDPTYSNRYLPPRTISFGLQAGLN